MTTGASCHVEALHRRGEAFVLERADERCHDCGVRVGGLHHLGCDWQRCPACRGQLLTCGCRFDEDPPEPDPDEDWLPPVPPLKVVTTSSVFEGRAFGTEFAMPDTPVWGPLTAVARLSCVLPDVEPFHESEFMYMGTERNHRKNVAIHLYKHCDTRRYLNLDDAGNAYAFVPSQRDEPSDFCDGRYRRYRSVRDAIDHLEFGKT